MNCFSCFSSQKKKGRRSNSRPKRPTSSAISKLNNKWIIETQGAIRNEVNQTKDNKENKDTIAKTFTFRELATATKNFRSECLVGQGGFGRVYRGYLSDGQSRFNTIAVKQLDRNGSHGNKEFVGEVHRLSRLHHPNLVNLIGYCADGDQRLLVYEYMSLGSLEDHLLDIPKEQRPLDWNRRMMIALDAAKGLEYLHVNASPPVIYGDLKSSNVLLDKDFSAKLSDIGLAKLGPGGDKGNVCTRVMGTYGYCAPEYQRIGQLTVKSDVYSFGVVLLEIITGRRAIDTKKPNHEQNLITWAQSFLGNPTKYPELADPLLAGEFPMKDLNQAVGIAAMCLQDEESTRPLMSDVVTTLKFLSSSQQHGDTSPPCSEYSLGTEYTDCKNSTFDDEIAQDRQRTLLESIEWGSTYSTLSRSTSKNSSHVEV